VFSKTLSLLQTFLYTTHGIKKAFYFLSTYTNVYLEYKLAFRTTFSQTPGSVSFQLFGPATSITPSLILVRHENFTSRFYVAVSPSAQFGTRLLCLWSPHLWCNLKRISAIHFMRRILRLLSYFNLLPTYFIGCVFPPRKQLAIILSTANLLACFIVVQLNRIIGVPLHAGCIPSSPHLRHIINADSSDGTV